MLDNITQNSTWMGTKPTSLCKSCAHSFLLHRSLQQSKVCASALCTYIFNRTLIGAGGMHVSSGPCAQSLCKEPGSCNAQQRCPLPGEMGSQAMSASTLFVFSSKCKSKDSFHMGINGMQPVPLPFTAFLPPRCPLCLGHLLSRSLHAVLP